MRVLICGSRDYADEKLVHAVLDGLYNRELASPFVVIEGGAKGADSFAGNWASSVGMPVVHERYPADWTNHGKSAGPIRNKQMLEEGKPDLVVGFSDDIYSSRGTKDMLNRAKQAGVKTILITRWQ